MSAPPGSRAGRSSTSARTSTAGCGCATSGRRGPRSRSTHGEALDAAGDAHHRAPRRRPPVPPRAAGGRPGRPGRLGRAAGRGVRAATHDAWLPVRAGRRATPANSPPTPSPASSCTPTSTRTGWFECSDERINRLHEAAVWSLRGNACDVPTDCPTRERGELDRRLADLRPHRGVPLRRRRVLTKWLRDLAAEQWPERPGRQPRPEPAPESEADRSAAMNGSAGWGDAAVIVPWEMYRAYGDARLLDEQWPSMVAWLGYVERAAAEGRHPDRIARSPRAASARALPVGHGLSLRRVARARRGPQGPRGVRGVPARPTRPTSPPPTSRTRPA